MATSRLRIIVDAVTAGATSALSGLGSAVGTATRTIAAGWTIAAGAMAATATSVFKTGIEFNTLNQKANAAFSTLLGSAEAASAMMSDITAFAKTSPFPRQAFITAAQQMTAFGIESQKVIPYLGSIQDAVAAAGGGSQQLSEISFVMSQISAAGKITGQDLIQFGQRGINAAELIGSQMGKTGAQIKADITDGALDATVALDALAAGMAARFGGAADKVKETWVGATDRVKGAMRDIGAILAEPIVGAQGGGLGVEGANLFADALRALMPVVQAVVDKVMELFGPNITGATSALTGLIDTIKGADAGAFASQITSLAPALGGITAALAALSGGALAGLPMIGPLLGGLASPIGIIAAAIAGLIAFSPELQAMLGGVLQTALTALAPILPVVSLALGTVANALGMIVTAIAPVIPMFAHLITMLVSNLAPVLIMVVSSVMPPLLGIINAVIPVLGVIIGAVAQLIPPFSALITAVMPPLMSIVTALTPVIATLGQVFAMLIPPVMEIITALLPILITVLDMVVAAVLPLIPPVLDLVLALVDLAIKAVMPLLDPLVMLLNALIPILDPILDLIPPFIDLIAALSPLIGLVAELAGIIVGALAGALGNLLSGALAKLAPLFEDISEAIGWVVDKLTEFVGWLGRIKIPDWLKSAGSWVGGLFKGAPTSFSATTFATGTMLRGGSSSGLRVLPRSSSMPSTINITVNAPLGGGDAIGRAIRDELVKLQRRRSGVVIGALA